MNNLRECASLVLDQYLAEAGRTGKRAPFTNQELKAELNKNFMDRAMGARFEEPPSDHTVNTDKKKMTKLHAEGNCPSCGDPNLMRDIACPNCGVDRYW